MKVELSKADLEKHLRRQLGLLKASCNSFDEGYEDEYARIALGIRVLVHDTKNSASLLGQLGLKDQHFVTYATQPNPNNLIPESPLVLMSMGPSGTKFMAPLDDGPVQPRKVPFEDWWAEPVFWDPISREFDRRTLICTAADQDGGAHVDAKLDADYAKLIAGDFLGWTSGDAANPTKLTGAERATIRQIAHEVLRTFDPQYEPRRKGLEGSDMIMSDFRVTTGPPEWAKPKAERQVAHPAVKLGRNQPCFCGSGQKYKRCHGRPGAYPQMPRGTPPRR